MLLTRIKGVHPSRPLERFTSAPLLASNSIILIMSSAGFSVAFFHLRKYFITSRVDPAELFYLILASPQATKCSPFCPIVSTAVAGSTSALLTERSTASKSLREQAERKAQQRSSPTHLFSRETN